jgi:hypothetical protein
MLTREDRMLWSAASDVTFPAPSGQPSGVLRGAARGADRVPELVSPTVLLLPNPARHLRFRLRQVSRRLLHGPVVWGR